MPNRPRVELRALRASLPGHADRTVTTHENGEFVRRSFATLAEDTAAAIDTLRSWGVQPGMRVGIISQNGYRWLVYDLALLEMRCVSVPFPETDASAADDSLCGRHELNLLLVSSRHAPADLADRPRVASMDGENPPGRQASPALPERFPVRDDDHSYVLGSGTSGSRKGMVASRRGVEAIIEDFAEGFGTEPSDSILVFMPLWSLQQRLFYYGALAFGLDLHVVESAQVFQAVRGLQPTILVAPPVFYEGLQEQNLTALFGPRTRVLITGMAKSRPATLEYFRDKGLPLYEVYALTETGMVSMNVPGERKIGSTGKPVPGTEVRIAEDGEIWVRKPYFQIRGYFSGVPDAPREWPNGELWPTGDIGHFDGEGFLYVDGRKDDILVLPSGQKVQPEAVEGELGGSPLVRRAVLLKDPENPYLVAVIDTDQRADPETPARLARLIAGINARLQDWARIERFSIAPEPFTPQNGMLTPNFKLNRSRVAAAFAAQPGYAVDELAAVE